MQLNQVEAFVNVVKYNSFSKAAQSMFLSQPTVSSYVKALEESLGVQLLRRTTKDLEMTEAGKAFYKRALQMLAVRDVSTEEAKKFGQAEPEELRIVVSSLSNWFHMPDVFIQAMRNQPLLRFELIRENSQGVINSILKEDGDMGLVAQYINHPDLSFIPIARERYILITPNTNFYASMNGSFPVNLFRSEPFVIREKGSNTLAITEQYLCSIGLERSDIRIAMETMNPESVQFMVKNEIGIGFINESAAQDYIRDRYVLPFRIDSPILIRQIYVVYNNNNVSEKARTFVNVIRECRQKNLERSINR